MKRQTSKFAILAIIAISTVIPSFASAQSTGVKKAMESAKETIDSLVSSKDGKKSDELSLRIQTLKQAVSLSIAEAKDSSAKLSAIKNLAGDELSWQTSKLNEFVSVISYFEAQNKNIDNNVSDITAVEVKNIAENFKAWREENYLPTLNEVRDYLLIDQQEKTVDMAKSRYQKIDEDIKKLEKVKVKNIDSARKMLQNANTLVSAGDVIIKEAHTSFFDKFITVSTSTATSSEITDINKEAIISNNLTGDNATSTLSGDLPQPKSIRDIVKDSSLKIRDAYKIFIDMSSLVRRLLK